jgi:hypothetical protein
MDDFDLLGEPADLCEGMTPRRYMRALGRALRLAIDKRDDAAQKAIVGRAELVMKRHPYLAPPPPRERLVRPMRPSKRHPAKHDRGVGVTRAAASRRKPTMSARVRHANLQARVQVPR